MEVSLNIMQLTGIWLMVTGLIMNTVIFIFSYYKVVTRLNKNEEETENDEDKKENDRGEEKKSFPIFRFVFHFRKILKDMLDHDKRENFELIVAFLKWALFLAVGMIILGLMLFLFGFFF